MEKMPFQPDRAADWRGGLPVLEGSFVTLREVEARMGQPLWLALRQTEVIHLFAPVPEREEDFEVALAVLSAARPSGSAFVFAAEAAAPIGLIAVRALEPGFHTAEWAFGFAPEAWTTRAPLEALTMVRDFVFEAVGAHRLESRTLVESELRITCLRQLGALEEGWLRSSVRIGGRYADQRLWTIAKADRVN
jgi:RimJ/RimL family protein N-acetyltransferase